jgi:hypothetical protein
LAGQAARRSYGTETPAAARIADLFGIHPGTAHTWAKFAQASWTDYLAAGTTSEPDAISLNG